MKRLLLILILVLATSCYASPGTGERPSKNPKAFWGEISTTFNTTDETIIGMLVVEDVLNVSVTATIVTSDNLTLAGTLKVRGANTEVALIADTFLVNDGSAIQTWSTTGAQTTTWVEDIFPCRYLVFTSTASSGATTPGTVTLDIKGLRLYKGGETTWE